MRRKVVEYLGFIVVHVPFTFKPLYVVNDISMSPCEAGTPVYSISLTSFSALQGNKKYHRASKKWLVEREANVIPWSKKLIGALDPKHITSWSLRK